MRSMDFIHIIANYPDMEQQDVYFNADDVRGFRYEEIDGNLRVIILVNENGCYGRFVSDSLHFFEGHIRK